MNIEDFITGAYLVEDYDTVRDGSFRLATPFRYPDESHIDVFLKDGGTVFDGFELSDKGQTVAYLLDLLYQRPSLLGRSICRLGNKVETVSNRSSNDYPPIFEIRVSERDKR